MKVIKVNEKGDGKKLVTYITSMYPDLKINTIYKALRKKDIKVNGKRISEDMQICLGDLIQIYITDDLLLGQKHKQPKYNIVFQDNNILVINKEPGIEVVGDNSITSQLKTDYEFIEPCHRIDRNTSGLVLFAKNNDVLQIILEMFKNNDIEKHYIACCYGLTKNYDNLEAFLFKDRKKSMVYISKTQQKGYIPIKTSYTTIKHNYKKNISLLDITLHTGRTHQIRAHLASAGFPIVGDGKYGSYSVNHKYKKNKQMLCSYSITLRNITNDKFSYLNNKTFKLRKIPYVDLFSEEK